MAARRGGAERVDAVTPAPQKVNGCPRRHAGRQRKQRRPMARDGVQPSVVATTIDHLSTFRHGGSLDLEARKQALAKGWRKPSRVASSEFEIHTYSLYYGDNNIMI